MKPPKKKYRIVSSWVDIATKRPTYYVEKRGWILWTPMNLLSLSLEDALACLAELEKNDP